MKKFKAPPDALKAQLDSEDFGIWVGNGRIVAESAAATIIYLDERFHMPLSKIGNSRVLRAVSSDPDISAALLPNDAVQVAGNRYSYRIRARQDPLHLADIRVAPDRYQTLDIAHYPAFVRHLEAATTLVSRAMEPNERVIYVGGRLHKRLLSISPMGDLLYVGQLAELLPGITIPIVNSPLFGSLFTEPTTWLVSDENMLVADRRSGIFLQAVHAEQPLPVRIGNMLPQYKRCLPMVQIPLEAFLVAVRLLQIAEPDRFTLQTQQREVVLSTNDATVPVTATVVHPIPPMTFRGPVLAVLEKALNDAYPYLDIGQSKESPVPHLMYRLPDRFLVSAALRS